MSNLNTRVAERASSRRSGLSGPLPYLSDRQTQAYLMARDTIRRIRRTSTIVTSIAKETGPSLHAMNRSQSRH